MNDEFKYLLRCFSKRSMEVLKYLETKHGCTRTEGFSRFDQYPGPDSLRESDFSNVPGLFSYVVRYSAPSAILDLSYGDRELLVEGALIYPQHNLRFGVWELAAAAGIPVKDSGLSGGSWVQTVERMERVVDEFGSALRPHWPIFFEPSVELLDRALVQRGQRMRFDQDEQRGKDRESACIQASQAFHRRNYRKAIELLHPFLKHAELPNSSRKVYEKALEKLGSEQ